MGRADVADRVENLLGGDAPGDRRHPELVREPHHRADDAALDESVHHPLDELAGDRDDVGVELHEGPVRIAAGAELPDGQQHAAPVQRTPERDGGVGVLERARLGEDEHQRPAWHPVALALGGDHAGDLLRSDGLRREAEGEQESGTCPLQPRQQRDPLAQDEGVESGPEPGPLGSRDQVAGRERGARGRASDEGLGPDDAPGRHLHDGL